MIPPELISLILEFHSPKCTLNYNGNPRFTLYWVYSKDVLKRNLGVEGVAMQRVNSKLGPFFKSVVKQIRY